MMRKILVILLLASYLPVYAQTMRYFEFRPQCGHGNWQDTSFIAATNDQTVIDTLLHDLTKPIAQRRFIEGPIIHGDGGHNHNASHWFLWHFVPGQWHLAMLAIEVCDGCPYTDVDADTAYWIGNIGSFCPWSGIPVREVTGELGIDDPAPEEISIYPNPMHVQTTIEWENPDHASHTLALHDLQGRLVKTISGITGDKIVMERDGLQNGLYFFQVRKEQQVVVTGKLIIE